MAKRVTMLFLALLMCGCFAWSAQHVFYGVVSDTNCGAKHSRASAAATACVKKCVAGGASYALVSHGKVYNVNPQDKFADFAGERVRVHGSLSGQTITAETVTAVHSHHHHAAASSSGGL
ncbi:MAG: hypothetical protein ACRD2B_14925 [Terriglobia bacterium]